MKETEHCISVCNRLLRGERSAVETYDKAIERFGSETIVIAELQRIRNDHANSVRILEQNVVQMGGVPGRDSGVWGNLVNTVQSAANLFGSQSAMEALETGEKLGKDDYEKALTDDAVLSGCKVLIRSELLPKTSTHISTIDRLQQAA